MPKQLKPFQDEGANWMAHEERGFLADDVGLGKTITALAFLDRVQANPAVVITTSSTLIHWRRKALLWTKFGQKYWVGKLNEDELLDNDIPLDGIECPEIKILNGKRPYTLPLNLKLIILNYSILPAWAEAIAELKPRAVLFDEGHKLNNAKSAQSVAARLVAKSAQYRWCLTATPFKNRPFDYLSPLEILGRLIDVGGFTFYKLRYCLRVVRDSIGRAIKKDYQGAENLDELQSKLGLFTLRRTKSEVASQLPKKRRTFITTPITQSVRKAISQETNLFKQRELTGLGKVEFVIEWVKNFLDGSEGKLVLFAEHRSVQQELIKAFPGCVAILGDEPLKKRQQAIDRFNTEPDVRICVASSKAASEGIDLTAAANAGFVELPFTASEIENQAEGRIDRLSQKADELNMYWFVSNSPSDQKCLDFIKTKRVVTSHTVDGVAPDDLVHHEI